MCGNEQIATHNILYDTIATICFVKCSTHIEKCFPLFPSPHSLGSQYFYHQLKWFLDFNKHRPSLFNVLAYDPPMHHP
jgi:hypothetical protein